MSKLILVIEDEPAIQNILRAFLLDAGYRVALADDGPAGVDRFRADPPDLVLLDLMLPGMDGFAVCQVLRRESRVPIIMLTALDDDDSQLKGFDALADDYITKPFSMPLVLKRIEAVLRRAGPADPAPDQADGLLRCGPVTLDPASQTVRVDGQCVSLTLREYDILKLLAGKPGPGGLPGNPAGLRVGLQPCGGRQGHQHPHQEHPQKAGRRLHRDHTGGGVQN